MGERRVKIELTEAEADRSLHPHHTELWIRVLSHEPIGPQGWDDIKKKVDELHPEALKPYALTPCAFHADIWDEDDPERQGEFGFEQWFVLPRHGGSA